MLFVPGHMPERIEKALNLGADAVMVDLEDAVPVASKPDAREATAATLRRNAAHSTARFVRLNGWGDGCVLDDLHHVVGPGLDGVALPKCNGAAQVRALDLVLSELELARGLAPGAIEILPMLESPDGILDNYAALTASPRVRRAGGVIGAAPGGDFHRAMGSVWGPDQLDSLYISSRAVLHARAAGLGNIICGPCTDLQDPDMLPNIMHFARRLGANGALAIHPKQVAVLNEIFSPSHEEIDAAHDLLSVLAAAVGEGRSALVHDGQMVDYAHARSATDLLLRAQRAGLDDRPIPELPIPSM